MDAMLNVLNSAPKITKKRKPKPEINKKNNESSSLSPQHHSKPESQSPSRSPLHSPSTLDLDSLTALQSPSLSNVTDELSFTEPTTLSDYVPLSTEIVVAEDVVIPDQEPTLIEKPPQLKVLIWI